MFNFNRPTIRTRAVDALSLCTICIIAVLFGWLPLKVLFSTMLLVSMVYLFVASMFVDLAKASVREALDERDAEDDDDHSTFPSSLRD